MREMQTGFVVVLQFAVILPALAEDSQAVKTDLARLQGEWTMVSGSADGYAIPDAMLADSRRVCKGNESIVTVGGQLIMKANFTVDPSQKPKTIDYDATDGPTKGKKHLGIYELDGDTVKFCFAAPDKDRPADFTSKPGERRTLSVWKLTKPSAP